MRVEHTAEGFQQASLRLTMVTVALGVSIGANLVIALVALGARQTILTPILPNPVVLSQTGGVSADYLEAVARDAAYLFLNRTPDNESFFDQQILRVADAATYQTIRDALIDAERRMAATHVSQTFIPTDWYVDAARLYVEVSGNLIANNGAEQPLAASKIYAMRFIRRGSGIRLLSFEEIKPVQALGAKLPVTPAPLERAIPISSEAR
jgi:conjugal transfer pilus assembly protein TraE